ncbi:radical SAM protein [Chlorobaculum sp. 24CR]|uniref:radical SAM/SPASM domain-containing protein n=1 Tax=Chlorobaculum sp. 24CR TaxID=2508878 RepID=UPI00100BC001|nr:radical SAM protein [Chlorobaculum sp. 24CR]RXK88396.1 radical SAM protein [Chlorobaculum sp. 24CR]
MGISISDGSVKDSGLLPSTFVFELTRRCNNECLYCYNVWRAPGALYHSGSDDEMTLDELREVIIKLQAETPVERIALSGGEPLLRKDLPEIIEFIQSRNIDLLLLTNGTLLTPEFIESTSKGVTYELPLLSTRREIHDRIVGHPGAWDAVVEAFLDIHATGIPFSAVFVATAFNWQELHATALMAMMSGASELLYKRVNMGGANLSADKGLFVTPSMIASNLEALDAVSEQYGFRVRADVVIEPCVVDIRRYKHVHFGFCPLAGSHSAFVIDPCGNVRICEHSPKILGNIKRDSFREMYHHPYAQDFRSVLPVECIDCPDEFLHLCRGGCKAAAAQSCGVDNGLDPFIKMNR